MDAHDSCHPQTTGRIYGQPHPGHHLPSFGPNLIRLHMMGLDLSLFHDRLMHLLAMLSCSLLPLRYGALIQSIGVNNRLDWAAIRKQAHHDHDQFRRCAQSFHHRASSCAEGLLACAAAIALWLIRMNTNVALSDFASCGTRLIG